MTDFELVSELHEVVGERITEMEAAEIRRGEDGWGAEDRHQVALTEIGKEVQRLDAQRLRSGRDPMSRSESDRLIRSVYHRMFFLGEIQNLVDDATNSDIHVNGWDRVHVMRRDGSKEQVAPVAASDDDLVRLISGYARRHGVSWDATNYQLDLQLPSGHRLHAIAWVTTRPSITVRVHDFEISTTAELRDRGTMSRSLEAFLRAAMLADRNTVIAGGTGAGKTTLARALINLLPPEHRLVVIEDSPELAITRSGDHPDAVEMHVRAPNLEGRGGVTMEQLVIEGLRMNPDHIIVGEFRGAEVREALLAMSQGEAASISTLHADSSRSVFARFQMYMAMTPERYDPEMTNLIVAQAVHLIVHVAKIDKARRAITSIREVTKASGRNVDSIEIYAPDPDGRAVPAHRPTTELLARLTAVGFNPRWLDPEHGGWDQ